MKFTINNIVHETENPVFIQMIGLPCSGKSTWTRKFQSEHTDFYVVSSDDMIESYAYDQKKTYNEVFEEYYPEAQELVLKSLTHLFGLRLNVILDGTNVTKERRQKFLSLVPEGYEKIGVIFDTPFEVCVARNTRPGKIIPLEVIQGMHNDMDVTSVISEFDLIHYGNQK